MNAGADVADANLELVVEVGNGAEAADNDTGADALGVIDGEATELVNTSLGLEVPDTVSDELDALVGREEGSVFVRIVGDGDDHLVTLFATVALIESLEVVDVNQRDATAKAVARDLTFVDGEVLFE